MSYSSRFPTIYRLALGITLIFAAACGDDSSSTGPDASPEQPGPGEFAPIPESAKGPQIDMSKGYHVEELVAGAYWVSDGSYQSLFFTTGQGVVVVDAPPTTGDKLSAAIAEVTSEPVTHFVYSHHHADHVGAAGQFTGATFIAHEEAAALIARAGDPNRPVPSVTFADQHTLTVGTQTLELSYDGINHEPGNIYIYAPQQKVLMLVDVVFPGWVPFAYLALAKDIPGYIEAHDKLLAFDFDHFAGGHLTRLGTRADIEQSRDYVLDVQAAAGQALQSVDFRAIGAEIGFENQWLLFDRYLDEVANQCAASVERDWVGVLGAADVFTHSHCWTMAEGLRID